MLGDALLRTGAITQAQLDQALAQQRTSGALLGQTLLSLNFITEETLARALAHVINLLDPDVVVVGGGLSGLDALYEDVPRLWGRWVFSDRVDTRLVPPRFGPASGVRGAAWLWP